MLMGQTSRSLYSIVFGLLLYTTGTHALQAEICLPGIVKMLEQGPGHYNSSWFFANGTNPANPILTLGGCQALCEPPGSKPWHYDAGQRITAWLLPIVVLVLNLDVSPLDKWRYIEVAHVLGDPICAMRAMLAKVFTWAWCATIAEREHSRYGISAKELGILLAGIEEILGARMHPVQALDQLLRSLRCEGAQSIDLEVEPQVLSMIHLQVNSHEASKESSLASSTQSSDKVVSQQLQARHPELKTIRSSTKQRFRCYMEITPEVTTELRETARVLADGRSDDILRTLTAVILYLLSFIGAYVNALGGGNNSPPAGRVALAVFLSWIIPVVLLSNAIGGFASRRTCFSIIQGMVSRLRDDMNHSDGKVKRISCTVLEDTLRDRGTYFGNQRWQGGSDVYRPGKHIPFEDKATISSSMVLLFLATSPLLISLSFSFAILWMIPPRGIDCRLMVPITITITWLCSALCTELSWRLRLFAPRHHWYFTALKDALIGFSAVLMIFLAHSGLFNTCECASFRLMYGARARVPLNVYYDSGRLSAMLFPILSGLCLFLEIMSFVIMCIVGRKGLRLMRWSEASKMKRYLE